MQDNIKNLIDKSNKNSTDLLIEFVDGMPGGFFIYRADGDEEILHINKALLGIFGCETYDEFAELTGNTFKGMVHPEDLENVEKSIAHQIAANKNNLDFVEYRINHKDGKTHWVADYGHYIQTDIGAIFYVFVSDNTERIKNRMETLEKVNNELMRISARESQYRRAILYDALFFYEVNITEDKFITTITQHYDGHMFDVFDAVNSSGDMKFSDFICFSSKHINQDEPDEYVEFFNTNRLIECFKNGEFEQIYDSSTVDTLGRKRLLHYVVLLGESGGSVTALVLAKDITEQIERQKLLQVSLRQAQAANIAKSTFLASMSHDIRTPLNAILGFADLIRMHIDEQDKTSDYLEKIKISGNQLLTIVNEALEVTRMEAGKAVLAETECHLVDLLAEVEKAVLPQMNSKSINFTIDKSGITHFTVYIDIIRTKEILCQLLDNAAKYTSPHGQVILSVRETLVSGGYGKYYFEVRDTGIGISQDFIEHMYEPFTREQNTTHSGIPGSGLGMAVVRSLVDLMDGKIEVESTLGEGTCFTVMIVLKQIEKESSTADAYEPISLKGRRILLVEDNEINREIAEALLTEEDFKVETASDGDIAVELIKNNEPDHFDFVLMDIQMPRMNGYEAARAIRKLDNERRASIPIIALSANAYSEDLKKSIEAGMDAHSPKPIDMGSLQNVMAEVIIKRLQTTSKQP